MRIFLVWRRASRASISWKAVSVPPISSFSAAITGFPVLQDTNSWEKSSTPRTVTGWENASPAKSISLADAADGARHDPQIETQALIDGAGSVPVYGIDALQGGAGWQPARTGLAISSALARRLSIRSPGRRLPLQINDTRLDFEIAARTPASPVEVSSEDRFYIPAIAPPTRPRRTLKHGDSFMVVDSHGDMGTAKSSDGLFHCDTRFLSYLELRVNASRRWIDVDARDEPGIARAGRLFTAQVERLRATYSFTSRAFVRLIGTGEGLS